MIPYLEMQKRSACDATEASYRHRTNSYHALNERIAKSYAPSKAFALGVCQIGNCNAIRVYRRLFGSPDEVTFFEGWPTGFEPATAGTTIRGSTVELRPPCKRGKGK
jgi:hypothetical protein